MTTNEASYDLDDLMRQVDGDTPPEPAPAQPAEPLKTQRRVFRAAAKGDPDALETMEVQGVETDLTKGWMRFHRLVLITSAADVRHLVDRALQVGRVSLDTETQGLDSRINYRPDGTPYTEHSIVGYCLGIEGEGYYIPVRHRIETRHDGNPNVDSVEETEAEITRLCLAAQPILKEGNRDVLAANEQDFEVPPRVIIEFWNAKFDQEMLYPVTGIDIWNPFSFEDGQLLVYTLDSDAEQSLKVNAKNRLPPAKDPETGEEHPYEMIEFEQLFKRGTKKSQRKIDRLTPRDSGEGRNVVLYGCSDAVCTSLLCKLLGPEVYKSRVHTRFYTIEKQVAQVVRLMERPRVLINKGEIAALLQEAEEELEACNQQIKKLAEALGFGSEFNPGSAAQLADLLFGPKGIWKGEKPGKTKEGQYKTDEKTIEKFAEDTDAPEVFSLILKFRRISKVRGTYLRNLANNTDDLDQIRLNFRPTGAATGRFTAPSGDPSQGFGGIPIQGIPARDDPKKPRVAHSLRRLFVARPGYVILKVDYASQELRIAASISGEPKWVAEYEKEILTGEPADLHFLTAQAFYPGLTKDSPDYKLKRGQGKTANFALIYGGGVGAVQRATGCDKLEGGRLKEAFDKSVPQFSRWVRGQKEAVKKHLRISTGFGRIIPVPDANISRETIQARRAAKGLAPLPTPQAEEEAQKRRASCERIATNYPIQGCLSFDSPVQTRGGDRHIGELAQSGESFEVWTGSRWAEATAHDMGPCERAQVLLADGTRIECDTRHKLLVVSDDGYEWVEYARLATGMAIATTLCEPLEFAEPPPLPRLTRRRGEKDVLHPDDEAGLWYWIGRYVGDGWLDPRGALVYTFGLVETAAAERCKTFWEELGFKACLELTQHRPNGTTSIQYRLTLWSVDLYDWLLELGLEAGVTAHTKRCPARIFSESINSRRGFLEGVMDSDGHKPPVRPKGNPYAVHLCQRSLLVDLKRLLRTVGVESIIRGPYRSGEDKQGAPTTSYRLDVQRRMFERNVMRRADGVRHAKFADMEAPQFLVDKFLAQGPFPKKAFRGDQSAYNLYLRLRGKGRVGVYTLRRLCGMLGVEFSVPIYAFKRLVDKKSLGREEHTYTLNVRDPLHRFESDGVITKNSGADILKISLILLVREFLMRGWLRNGGDDSVRILMTIHDEVVFEVREERVAEAVPIITQIMESPYKRARWKVPLVAEAELGESWAAKLSWSAIVKGKVPRPRYLEGREIDPHAPVMVLGGAVELPSIPLPAAAPEPSRLAIPSQLPAGEPMEEPKSVAAPPTPEPAAPELTIVRSSEGSAKRHTAPSRRVASFLLKRVHVDRKVAVTVASAMAAAKFEGIRLERTDPESAVEILVGGDGKVVVFYSADQGYYVHADELAINLRRLDLLDSWEEREEVADAGAA